MSTSYDTVYYMISMWETESRSPIPTLFPACFPLPVILFLTIYIHTNILTDSIISLLTLYISNRIDTTPVSATALTCCRLGDCTPPGIDQQ